MMKRIMEIQKDPNLSDSEKAVKRQQLMAGKWATPADKLEDIKNEGGYSLMRHTIDHLPML